MKQHKHHKMIKAWANGARIQYKPERGDGWIIIGNPNWSEHCDYRVDPTLIDELDSRIDSLQCELYELHDMLDSVAE